MKFFTDKSVVNDYLLVKIKDYKKMTDFSRWKEVFIDPGVYDLVKDYKFSWEGKIGSIKLCPQCESKLYCVYAGGDRDKVEFSYCKYCKKIFPGYNREGK